MSRHPTPTTESPADDSYRFSDDAARKLGRDVGVYGGGVTPGVTLRSHTGVQRGEELYCRPELERPWRAPSTQRHAEAIVIREQEIEVLTRKCTELRAQLAAANRELQRSHMTSRHDFEKITAEKDSEIAELRAKLSAAERRAEEGATAHGHQLNLLRTQHEADTAALAKNLKTSSDIMNDMSISFQKQMEEVRATATREVDLMQRLCHTRTTELGSEIEAANENAKRAVERATAANAELHGEMKRNEERLLSQLKEQEGRFESMRTALQVDKLEAERQRDKAIADRGLMQEKCRGAMSDLTETETRFRDWNTRLLSDLEQLAEYYTNMIRDIEGNDAPTVAPAPEASSAKISEAYVPPRAASDMAYRRTMERLADTIHHMTWMKQHHSNATQALLRKVRAYQSAEARAADDSKRHVMDMDMQYSRLVTEVSESKAHQLRLEAAMVELRDVYSDTESLLSSVVTRLDFFNKDLHASVTNPTNCVIAPKGVVTFVAMCVEGAPVLWEQNPALYGDSLALLNQCLRAKLAQHGGYEVASEGDMFMSAFQDPIGAIRFALEIQTWSMGLPWAQGLLNTFHAAEEFGEGPTGDRIVLFRGLRLHTGVHLGEVGVSDSPIPTGGGKPKAHYFGKVIGQTLHVASLACGGQVLASTAAWTVVEPHSTAVGSPLVSGGGNRRVGSGDSAETIPVVSLVPPTLRNRHFHENAIAPGQGEELSASFTATRRLCVETEVEYLKAKHNLLQHSMEALLSESDAVKQYLSSVDSKVRDARITGGTYSQADAIAHAAAIDRLSSRSSQVHDEMKRFQLVQQELTNWVRNLEDALSNFCQSANKDDDTKRRFGAIQERAQERMHELSGQYESKLTQMRNTMMRLEEQNNELRLQLQRPASSATLPSQPLNQLRPNSALSRPGTRTSAGGLKTVRPSSSRASRPATPHQ